MNPTEIMAVAGYPIVGLAGFVLGTLLGRTLVSDTQSVLHSIESRLATVQGQVTASSSAAPAPVAAHATAAPAVAPAATVQTASAIQAHAAATEKLAAAVVQHAAAVTATAPASAAK